MTESNTHHQKATDDPTAEDFPRVELNRLVGESLQRIRMRRVVQALLLSVGLTLVALGLPTERYFDGMEALWHLAGSGSTPQSLVALPILATHSIFGIGLEPAAFLWAAIMYGASVFLLLRLTQGIGFDHGVALASTLVVTLAPLAWLGGTLPIDFSAGLLGSTLLCTSLFQVRQHRGQGYLWRAATYLVLAIMLQPECAWLLPAALWAVHSHGKSRVLGGANAFGLAAVCMVCLWTSVEVGGGQWNDFLHAIVGTGPGTGSWLAGLGFWSLGLGVAWLGITRLLFGRREAEEQPAPTWVLAWVAVGVAPILTGGLNEGPRGAFLLPMAAVGVADWLTRRVHDDKRAIVAGALVSGQILLTCFSSTFLARTDPNRAWYLVAQNLLQESDLFVVQSAPRAYLAQFRLDIATRPTDARGVKIHRGTHVDRTLQRLVLDGWAATDGDPLRLPPHEPLSSPDGLELRPEALLTKEGLIPLRQVP